MIRYHLRVISTATFFALAIGAIGVLLHAPLASAESGPAVTLTSTVKSPTNLATIPITATFSESVAGFSTSSIQTTNATIDDLAGSGTTYTFDLHPTNPGSVSVSVAAGAATSTTATSTAQNLASNTLSFTYSTTSPTLSNIAVTPTQTGASVTWMSSAPTFDQLYYGETTNYGSSTIPEGTASTTHMASLSNLRPDTMYHFYLKTTDEAGNVATSSDQTFKTLATATSTASSTAPVISHVSVSGVGTSSATITWTTDQSATGAVLYGTSPTYSASTTEQTTAGTTSHQVMLSGLQRATLYHFAVRSMSTSSSATSSALASSTTATSPDMTFMTESTASSTPLAVTGVDAVRTTAIADNSFADGWQWTIHLTLPSNENAFRMMFSDWTAPNSDTIIPAAGNIRIFSAQSSNANSSGTAIASRSTNGVNSFGDWLYLNGDTATSTAGRQIDLTVQVRVPNGTAAGSYSANYTAQSYPSNATSTANSGTPYAQTQSDGVITFGIPNNFGLATTPQQVTVQSSIAPCAAGFEYCLFYNGTNYQGTTFDSAGLAITKRNDLTSEQACLNTPPTGFATSTQPDSTNSQTGYSTSVFSSAGNSTAGHDVVASLYRLFDRSNASCYQFQPQIATITPGATSTTQFTSTQQQSLMSDMNAVLQNLKLGNQPVTFSGLTS